MEIFIIHLVLLFLCQLIINVVNFFIIMVSFKIVIFIS